MELYRPTNQEHFQELIDQSGNGIDRYVYNMQGAGVGSFFAKLLKTVIPVAKRGIKVAVTAAKPHIKRFGNQLLDTAQDEAINQIEQIRKKRRLDNLDHE